jgi:hypothetical protein
MKFAEHVWHLDTLPNPSQGRRHQLNAHDLSNTFAKHTRSHSAGRLNVAIVHAVT